MKILPKMQLATRKSPLNFGSYPAPDLGIFDGVFTVVGVASPTYATAGNYLFQACKSDPPEIANPLQVRLQLSSGDIYRQRVIRAIM